jgi:hypothetical protein
MTPTGAVLGACTFSEETRNSGRNRGHTEACQVYSEGMIWRVILALILLILAGLVFYAFIYRNLKRAGQ